MTEIKKISLILLAWRKLLRITWCKWSALVGKPLTLASEQVVRLHSSHPLGETKNIDVMDSMQFFSRCTFKLGFLFPSSCQTISKFEIMPIFSVKKLRIGLLSEMRMFSMCVWLLMEIHLNIYLTRPKYCFTSQTWQNSLLSSPGERLVSSGSWKCSLKGTRMKFSLCMHVCCIASRNSVHFQDISKFWV